MTVASAIIGRLQDFRSFFNITHSYFRRRNPFMNMIANTLKSLHFMLSTGKKIKNLKYQVQLMYYRMHQMEKLMAQNNPYSSSGGSSLNSLR
jgi:hypothetical protein